MKKMRYLISNIIIMIFIIAFLINIPINSNAEESIWNLNHNLFLRWEASENQNPIVPRDEVKRLNITVEYSFSHGIGLSEGMYLNYINYLNLIGPSNTYSRSVKVKIRLEIIEKSDWVHAVFRYPIVTVNLSPKYITQMPLYLLIDEDAPAYSQGYLLIKASNFEFSSGFEISSDEKIFNLSFQPSYYPSISVNLPDVNTVQIAPHETATFQIEINNLGNDQTRVTLRAESPQGWKATVTDEVLILKNETKSAILSIRPPLEFGYHEDVGIVRLLLSPARAFDLSEKGDNVTLNFLVQSKGFFIEGQGLFSFIWIVLLLIIIIFIVRIILIKKLKNRK
jgi:hypothetical protein